MILLTEFTVLLERRRSRRVVGALIAAMMLVAALFGARMAAASPHDGAPYGKIAPDLQVELGAPGKPSGRWARDTVGQVQSLAQRQDVVGISRGTNCSARGHRSWSRWPSRSSISWSTRCWSPSCRT